MGKRSDFKRRASDKYLTPFKGVLPLVPYISHLKTFVEPCAGDGRLVHHLERVGLKCVQFFDREPDSIFVDRGDAFTAQYVQADAIISNPPWDRKILHPMIMHFMDQADEVWLLFDADWSHTKQSKPYMRFCTDIVPVGRLIWIDDTKTAGKDNSCWHRFSKDSNGDTLFHS